MSNTDKGLASGPKNQTIIATAPPIIVEPEKAQQEPSDISDSEQTPLHPARPQPQPQPQIFAILRNGYEVMRGNMVEIQNHLDAGEERLDDAVEMYRRLHKWADMHKLMEEGRPDMNTNAGESSPKGFFAVLDQKLDHGVAPEGGFRSKEHEEELQVAEEHVEGGIQTEDLSNIREAYAEYRTIHETHLKKEEDIMMAQVLALEEAGENMKELMVTEILALVVDSDDFKFFVQHANYMLDRHHGEMPKARVFDHALWVCATPEQWKIWRSWIKGSVSEERYNEIMAAISF